MTPSNDCLALIQHFEGCAQKRPDGRYEAYPDPASGGAPWTIGWGSTGPGIKLGTIWTQAECDARLAADVAKFGEEVTHVLAGAKTNQHQYDSLVSFAYNAGIANLRTSTLLKLHREGDYAGAQRQFAIWIHAAGKVLPGLVKRRIAEAELYGRVA